ncbi:DNA repair helicase [Gloeophyllum trabeum ATCC 11539]|uniref:ATP-dependent DNA helicase CHL1 n=1 Tax=Gloeophyllum trabeum (strain ATCC 11539 / FP-39264 / Madison 617) TaxID=670483 RepID=S7RK14_GLOTA|nr:DNA repair helicase [Gloeophyllum trabeum ATCC 11539]EPQ54725.1 DNA repair helicase [Gloeophyllum trabeum ATCC 11539]
MSLHLHPPDDFLTFPYELPYDIQTSLMQHIYSSIEDHQVSIIESPTGTGKTLSLLCSSLTWLSDNLMRSHKAIMASLDHGDWVTIQDHNRRQRDQERIEKEYQRRLAELRKNELILRKASSGRVHKRRVRRHLSPADMDSSKDESFLPDNVDTSDVNDNISPAVRALMKKVSQNNEEEPNPVPIPTKIYYASRTHSQLSQVLSELRKLKHSAIFTCLEIDNLDETETDTTSITKTTALGSRKHLCINEEVKRLRDIDEACREMQSGKTSKRCPHLPSGDDRTRLMELRDHILASPKDIEELVEIGQSLGTCPYFGSREAIPQAELVLLPYNLLLDKTAREALKIDLTDQIVIIDEAHNLISTLLSLATISLSFRLLSTCSEQLRIYFTKFRTRLTSHHALHLKRLMILLDALRSLLSSSSTQKDTTQVLTVGEFTRSLGRKVEGVNFAEVETYLRSSKIARKISGYADQVSQDTTTAGLPHARGGALPPLYAVESFLMALNNPSEDGRVTISGSKVEESEIKYQHLNPSTHFIEVIDSARSVILAGGTMSPMSDFTHQLFSHIPSERISTFSCGHVIPSTNLQTLILKKGPAGGDLLFKYDQRSNTALVAELGQIISNFTNVISGGMVIFFPSYSFLDKVKVAWTESKLLDKIAAKKKIFYEPRDNGDVDAVLQEYTRHTDDLVKVTAANGRKPGALMFAVVGAKLSEGLNFSDDLARAVLVVGLPFANLNSPELKERLKYVKALQSKGVIKSDDSSGARDAGMELYENMCMNAVNQSIGRAIRHRGDWASLILVDCRYASPRIRKKLPKWIGDTTLSCETFGQAMKELGAFFRQKRG